MVYIIEKYANWIQGGVVGGGGYITNWLIEGNEIRLNHGTGVVGGSSSIIRENYNGIIVSSAGNGYNNSQINNMVFPASYEPVISVAPLGLNDNWNHWAHFHHTIDISAPGENIYSTILNNQYGYFTGSSQASPIVASAFALLSSFYPEYYPIHLKKMILENNYKFYPSRIFI